MKNKKQEKIKKGEEILSWTFPEYEKHQRGKYWYLSVFVLGSLLFVYCLKTSNFLFAIIIVMVGLILFFSHKNNPLKIKFSILKNGILLDDKFYPYLDLEGFWIVYDPPEVKRLYIIKNNIFKTYFSIPFKDISPLEIREILSQYLEEDLTKDGEAFSDAFGRIFKI